MIGLKPRPRGQNGNGIPKRVHLVGAGGIHMSAIGQILLQRGHEVTGSDITLSEHTARIERLGGTVYQGHAASNLGRAELVVTTAAAKSDNPELLEAAQRGVPVVSRADMVQRLIAGREVIAVAGTHGKTTTSSLVALMAVRADLDPLVLLGGDARDLGDANARDGAGRFAIVEADEYARAFLQYDPYIALVTNVEPDHLDYYVTAEAYHEAFTAFARRVRADGTLIVCADHPGSAALGAARAAEGARVERYGIEDESADWRATRVRGNDHGGLDAVVRLHGAELGRLSLSVPGRHNLLNALGALAASMRAGVDFYRAAQAATDFQGARRRFEVLGDVPTRDGGIATVVDDYAHHPTEVRATLLAARQRFPGRRLVGCFQPHTYTRTEYLLDEFKTCFDGLDVLTLLRTYEARETADRGLDATALAAALPHLAPTTFDSFEVATEALAETLRNGDVLFTIGAGDVTEVGPMVIERLGGVQ
ncbi:MAG: UDP-N-acetylmuramate--L-alanine ligase [Chloroflexi bacterium]|nr:UDP-N-acetylmuramate--L-alanine ligase [Chloroflexota bacterium]MQC25636.1 UDP-N-acetylmuramate--L-alanine ligase [Chloroflexota bacterium]